MAKECATKHDALGPIPGIYMMEAENQQLPQVVFHPPQTHWSFMLLSLTKINTIGRTLTQHKAKEI